MVFFFQAEDGIRDDLVTGVQTCALPICSVELLSREGEIAIAKRIEEGVNQMLTTLAYQPQMIAEVLGDFDRMEKGEMRLSDIISGYIEPDLEGVEEEEEGGDDEEGGGTTKAAANKP